jgi:hypothetical protein
VFTSALPVRVCACVRAFASADGAAPLARAYNLVAALSCAATLTVLRRDYGEHYRPQASLVDEAGVGAASSCSREEFVAVCRALQARALREAQRFRTRAVEVLRVQDHWQHTAASLVAQYEALVQATPAVRASPRFTVCRSCAVATHVPV